MRISDWSSDVCSSDLEATLGIDREGRVNGFQKIPDDLRVLLRTGLGPGEIEVGGFIGKFGNETASLERISRDGIGSHNQQRPIEKPPPDRKSTRLNSSP